MIQSKIQSIQSNQSAGEEEVIDNDETENEQIDDNFTCFDLAYRSLDPEKMWTLKSGRIVEKVIYEYAKELKRTEI